MQTIRSRTIAAFGAILATGASIVGVAPAHAATYEATAPDQVRQVVVSLRGVTLDSPEGMVRMHSRIRAAARQVCGPVDLAASRETLACRRAAIADAQARLDARTAPRFAAR